MSDKSVETFGFESSNLHSAIYVPGAEELYIRFNSGDRIYRYEGVPYGTWKDLKEAPSAGSFFNSVVRGTYSAEEVTRV